MLKALISNNKNLDDIFFNFEDEMFDLIKDKLKEVFIGSTDALSYGERVNTYIRFFEECDDLIEEWLEKANDEE